MGPIFSRDMLKPFRGTLRPESAPVHHNIRGVILISIDTLRADVLGCYGNPDATSPYLDALARRNIVFQNTMVQLPGTLPSHMSMLTSLYPKEHDVYPPKSKLNPEIRTAADFFRAAGYYTIGITEGGYVKGIYGFDQGFDQFNDESKSWSQTLQLGIESMQNLEDDDQFFLFLHTYEVHDPYRPHSVFRDIFVNPAETPVVDPTGPNLSAFNRGNLDIDLSDVEIFRGLYTAEVRYMDSQFRKLWRFIWDNGWQDLVMILVTSDHGEEFLDHGRLVHEQIYQPLIQVPLLMRAPEWRQASIVPFLAESVDLLPTMLGYVGLKVPGQCSGQDLITVAELGSPMDESFAFSEGYVDKNMALQILDNEGYSKVFVKNLWRGERMQTFISQSADLDVIGSRAEIRMHAYHDRRHVKIFYQGTLIDEFTAPRRWKTVTVELPAGAEGRINTLHVVCDGCQRPCDVSESLDRRCLSLCLRPTETVPLMFMEYYDLSLDPAERFNLARDSNGGKYVDDGYRLQTLNRDFTVREHSLKIELDKEVRNRLQALGYLN